MVHSGNRLVVVLVVGFACLGILHSETRRRDSAWAAMIRDNPAIVDDASVGWKDRLILSVLSREQAEAYYQGTRAEEILLDNGQTLAEYLEARLNQPGNVYVPLPVGCELFSVEGSMPGETQAVKVRGQCGIPDEATAVILQISAESAGMRSRVKVWAADLPEPAEAVVDRGRGAGSAPEAVTTVLNLCLDKDCDAGDLRLRSSEATRLRSEVLGYFRPVNVTDGVGTGAGILYYTEGDYNSFFGTGAGASNGVCDPLSSSQSCYNTFVGAWSGTSNTTGWANAFFGSGAGFSNTTGYENAFFGRAAGYYNTTGSYNAFFGAWSGLSNTTGGANAFFGRAAGLSNTTGFWNAFFGTAAGYSNTTGSGNTFFGPAAGYFNTTGSDNAFFGAEAGRSNTTGYRNAFFGETAGYSNTTGEGNSFFGGLSGTANTTGSSNSFVGVFSGRDNTTGYRNAFFGAEAGRDNTVEDNNTFVGFRADLNPGPDPATSPVANATAIGSRALVSQSNSLVLGSVAGINEATANTQVGIGVTAPQRLLHIAGSNAVFRMDRNTDTAAFMIVRTDAAGMPLKTFVVGVNSRPAAPEGEFVINDLGPATGGAGSRRMTINNAGNVTFTGSVTTPDLIETSSLRFKANVRTLEDPLELVRQLRGVRFNWKDSGRPSVGLIAEEVAQVLPELVAVEANGEPSGVNYSKLVAVLIETAKAQQEKISRLEARLAEMDAVKARLALIEARLK